MTINLATNIAIRNRVRADLLLPRPVDLAGEIGIEDLTAEQLARLEKLRLFNARFLGAVKSGNPNAIEETRPRRGAPPATGRLQSLVAGTTLAGGLSQLSFGPIGYPYIIREVVLTAMSIQAAGVEGHIAVTLHLTSTDNTGVTAAPAERAIWPDENATGARREAIVVIGGDSNTVRYAAGTIVATTGLFLTAFMGSFPAGSINGSIGILIEELEFGAGGVGQLFQRPVGRINISPATRPPPPRSRTPSTPRGATIRVTQGSRILAERIIAWESLAPELKREWFNQQVGAPPNPTIEWIR